MNSQLYNLIDFQLWKIDSRWKRQAHFPLVANEGESHMIYLLMIIQFSKFVPNQCYELDFKTP